MIVDQQSLDVRPVADQLLDLVGGAEDMDVERGEAAWSNELALHVIEIKTAGPAADLAAAARVFRQQVDEIRDLLSPMGCTLLPSGMHPWMDPARETRLWPHQNNVIYQTFDRIFDCRGHGWSNLQSTHINFPFADDEEFARVHAACRFVLPLLPAIAASSPFVDGNRARALDHRLVVYEKNCAKVPQVTGRIVPERVYTEKDYQKMLAGVYSALAPHDPEGILAEEWVNARGCIARFDRGAVEIRLLDTQECPEQDLCVVAFVTRLVQALAEGQFSPLSELEGWSEEALLSILQDAMVKGRGADAGVAEYARALGSNAGNLGSLLGDLAQKLMDGSPHAQGLALIIDHGSLAERLVENHTRGRTLKDIYRDLESCLARGIPFIG